MNIFIIYSGNDRQNVIDKEKELKKINDKDSHYKKANVLWLNYDKDKPWKSKVRRLIKSAQLVVYIVSAESHKSENINWELRQARKHNKSIVVLNEGNYKLNDCLDEIDQFTRCLNPIGTRITTLAELIDIVENYENGNYIHLFNIDDIEPEKLFEQYKLFSDTSESLVSRRQNVNSFYITANTALITIAASVFSSNDNLLSQLILTIVLTFPGILLNISWLKVMESYSLINSSKMKILGMLEKKLSASIFDAEWEVMSCKYNKKRYVSFSDREKYLPIIFNGAFILVDIICLVVMFIKFVI